MAGRGEHVPPLIREGFGKANLLGQAAITCLKLSGLRSAVRLWVKALSGSRHATGLVGQTDGRVTSGLYSPSARRTGGFGEGLINEVRDYLAVQAWELRLRFRQARSNSAANFDSGLADPDGPGQPQRTGGHFMQPFP